jgi:hypothetical protein
MQTTPNLNDAERCFQGVVEIMTRGERPDRISPC